MLNGTQQKAIGECSMSVE